MKKTLIALALTAISANAHAMGNPQFTALTNAVEFGKYIDANMQKIIDSSVELAKLSVPNRRYFLITESITLNTDSTEVDRGEKPFASIRMSSSDLLCERDVFSKVTANSWGEQRQMNFSLSKEIRCSEQTK